MRKVDNLDEISDGRIYGLNDMVRADCQDCQGCSDCCRSMGKSIILDPLDVFQLTKHTGLSFEQLLADKVELNVVDGIILPNLKMSGPKEQCAFLNEEGRCSIHAFRPGICRLFPLGRCYDEHSFQYFLQVNECSKKNRTKVKVSKWIDTPDLKRNQQFILDWHNFLKVVENLLLADDNEELHKNVNMILLNSFFVKPYNKEGDFYNEFEQRLLEVQKAFSI
ncbi:MAG: YkgJ family cysteine cluster protein [Clostridium sp.]|nr:YkgJ family cysteine cluster protein [Clostridium sp.]